MFAIIHEWIVLHYSNLYELHCRFEGINDAYVQKTFHCLSAVDHHRASDCVFAALRVPSHDGGFPAGHLHDDAALGHSGAADGRLVRVDPAAHPEHRHPQNAADGGRAAAALAGQKLALTGGKMASANANIDMNGATVTGLKAPSANSDAATKAYVDAVSST